MKVDYLLNKVGQTMAGREFTVPNKHDMVQASRNEMYLITQLICGIKKL